MPGVGDGQAFDVGGVGRADGTGETPDAGVGARGGAVGGFPRVERRSRRRWE